MRLDGLGCSILTSVRLSPSVFAHVRDHNTILRGIFAVAIQPELHKHGKVQEEGPQAA